jgi:hypothetical protein
MEPLRPDAEPSCPNVEAPGSVGPDRFVGDWGGINTSLLHPNGHLLPYSLKLVTDALSLSLSKLSAPKSLVPISVIP